MAKYCGQNSKAFYGGEYFEVLVWWMKNTINLRTVMISNELLKHILFLSADVCVSLLCHPHYKHILSHLILNAFIHLAAIFSANEEERLQM